MINAYALLEVDGVQKTLPAAAEGPLGCGLVRYWCVRLAKGSLGVTM